MSRMLIAATLAFAACAERHVGSPDGADDGPKPIDDLSGLPGTPCGSPLMVTVTMADGVTTFCIDRFEARLDSGARGAFHQGTDDTDTDVDGSTNAVAEVALDALPTSDVSWYQAKSACANAGKRLCSTAEWERACRGPEGFAYPYGNINDEIACVGFFAYPEHEPEHTGSRDTCGSAFGAYDMSGNLEEWTLDAVPRQPGLATLDDRAVRGGSYRSNASALACAGPEFHEAPGTHDTDRGFRCCADTP
jgi:formylglycine-generating enzyme